MVFPPNDDSEDDSSCPYMTVKLNDGEVHQRLLHNIIDSEVADRHLTSLGHLHSRGTQIVSPP